ncbi:unnamed protein product [Amoebophrya sp. A120]|nr:unnamed protein product [Amoebophrya sp. A120]|eukprot:GSA120T00022586001.1
MDDPAVAATTTTSVSNKPNFSGRTLGSCVLPGSSSPARSMSSQPSSPKISPGRQHQQRTKRIGVLGGSFDPITEAHLTTAAGVVQAGCVDEVWLLPCGARPDKPSLKTPVKDRVLMCHLAVNTRFDGAFPIRVCELEADAQTYIPTFEVWKELTKQANINNDHKTEVYIIIGSDLIPTLPKWKFAEEVFEQVPFLVYARDGYEIPGSKPSTTSPKQQQGQGSTINGNKNAATSSPNNIRWPRRAEVIKPPTGMHLCTSNGSSSEVRNRIRQFDAATGGGALLRDRNLHCVAGLVPQAVLNHIMRENLYRT